MMEYKIQKYIERNLKNICRYFTGNLNPERKSRISNKIKNEINYVFGVPMKELKEITNLGKLIETTIKYKNKNSDFKNDLENGLEEMLSLC